VHARGAIPLIRAIVRYLVHPESAGPVPTDSTKELLAKLNAAPDRLLFPKGSAQGRVGG
jgi:hypothetical protein